MTNIIVLQARRRATASKQRLAPIPFFWVLLATTALWAVIGWAMFRLLGL